MTTLVVEDGSALSNSNCYVSQADCVTFFTNRGVTDGFASLVSNDQIIAILRGAQYLDAHYLSRWKAYKLLRTQAMAWPRVMSAPLYQFAGTPFALRSISYLLDADGFPVASNQIPQAVIDANCLLADAYARGVDLTVGLVSPSYKSRKAGDTQEVYAAAYRERDSSLINIDQMLEPFLLSVPGATFTNVQVVRG
jgi:hypothetical protein